MDSEAIATSGRLKEFCMYCKQPDGEFKICYSRTKEIATVSFVQFSNIQKQMRTYEQFRINNEVASDRSLRESVLKFSEWCEELKNNDIYSIDVSKYIYFNHLVLKVAEDLCHDLFDTKIDATEAKWINACYNNGIKYCKKGYKGNNFAYDYSMNYPKIMSTKSFLYPTRKGKEQIITELPTDFFNIPHGFYRVKIKSDHPNFPKIFSCSPDNVYLHESLKTALRYQKEFNIKIKLFQDGEPNAYLYNEDDLVNGEKVFGKWFEIMRKLKQKFPKNVLVKLLCSSLHGILATANVKKVAVGKELDNFCKSSERDDYEFIDVYCAETKSEYYKYKNIAKPFKHNIRIKAWIHAYARNKISRLVLLDPDNVVRVNVDCAVFTHDILSTIDKTARKYCTLDLPSLKLEDKYSGYGIWHHLTKLEKL